MKSVAVYCGSSSGTRPEYAAAAQQFGSLLAKRGITLIYGGGDVGMMGAIANGVLASSGHVIGVIPQGLADKELAHNGVSEMHVVESMHERKAMMVKLADAFVALPGGFGTFDELCEVATWCQLGYTEQPIGMLNVASFFDPLLQQFQRAVEDGFLRQEHRDLILHDDDAARLLDRLSVFERGDVQKWIDRDASSASPMRRVDEIGLLVRDYDIAAKFFSDTLGFSVIEDTPLAEAGRRVRVRPAVGGPALLLTQAIGEEQLAAVGNQAGDEVFLFLRTSKFEADYRAMRSQGVKFLGEPEEGPIGLAVDFHDVCGNKWKLIQASDISPVAGHEVDR